MPATSLGRTPSVHPSSPSFAKRSTRRAAEAARDHGTRPVSPASSATCSAPHPNTTFCVAPTGDSDGFTQRFYYILAAGCIPVGLDTG